VSVADSTRGYALTSFDETGSGERARTLPLVLTVDAVFSFLMGAGADKICAAVGPFTPLTRLGGVTEPGRTGKSSALGTRWGLTVAAPGTRLPFTPFWW
jgi:hypothetical protein